MKKKTIDDITKNNITLTPKQVIEQVEQEENKGVQKSTHTNNPTCCIDIRRGGSACGICGSYNIAYQGVKYCEVCGKEEEYLTQENYHWWHTQKEKPICNCELIRKDFYGHIFKVSPRGEIGVIKCLDCGAVSSTRLCPNCGKTQRAGYGGIWKHWDGRVKCSRCGFTIGNPDSCGIGANKIDINAQGKQGTKKAKEAAKSYMSKRKQKRLRVKNQQHPNKVK